LTEKDDREDSMAKPVSREFYTVVGSQRFGGQVHTLLRFNIPKMSKSKRRAIIEGVMEEMKADALVECFWTKGSLMYKNQWAFDAILITDSTRKEH
jgi:hypothetical protein